ncbi:flagellar basal-body MS-ring/collar protein FliF [Tabrizicola sp.]|uniref:flagellar basal-body MS-ring/collar protein FliF n=1 Tax=Tabrizicola sp. TaxID=2005166 RepID=UPI0035B48D20
MKQFLENLAGLGRRRLILLGVTGAGLVLTLLIGLGIALTPTYRPFVTDASPATASQILDELEQAGFAPKTSEDGSMISLPEGDIARARMILAEAGLPAADASGWSLFDSSSTIGMNSFLQQINRLRALEGELVQSIESMDAVEDARVHLVLPERESFSQDRPDATASVIVRAARGQTFERRQALAVRSLVAAAVPGLSPDRVTVLTAAGQTILSEEGTASGMDEAQIEIEERLRRNIETILGAHVGAENVRVRVTAELETERRTVVEQSFDPAQSVPRLVTSSKEGSSSQEAAPGTVDVGNNLAATEGSLAGGGTSESRSKETEEKQFEIGSVRKELIAEPGSIRRLTVAAVVNGTWDGTTYTERSPEELERLAALVRTAAGIDEGRGDVVSIDSLQFAEGPELSGEEGSAWSDLLSRHLDTVIRALMALAAIALVALLVVRPALRQLARPAETEAALPALDGLGGMQMALAGPMAMGDGGDPMGLALPSGGEGEDFLSFFSVQGNVMRRYVDDFSRIVETEPEAAVRTIRAWINQRG